MSHQLGEEQVPAWVMEQNVEGELPKSSAAPSEPVSTSLPQSSSAGATEVSTSYACAPQGTENTPHENRTLGDPDHQLTSTQSSASPVLSNNDHTSPINDNADNSRSRLRAGIPPPISLSSPLSPATAADSKPGVVPPVRETEIENSPSLFTQAASPKDELHDSTGKFLADCTVNSANIAIVASPATATVPTKSRSTSQKNRRSTTHAPRQHLRNFKNSDVNYANFFFHNEDAASFGVGTVGLYAAKTAQVVTTATTTVVAPATTPAHPSTGRSGGRATAAATTAGGMNGSTEGEALTRFGDNARLHHGQEASQSARRLQSPLDTNANSYDSVHDFLGPKSGASLWAEREADYRQWKSRNLASSSYGRFSRIGQRSYLKLNETNHHNSGTIPNREKLSLTASGEGSCLDLPVPWSREEQMTLEQRRLRALETERAAKSAAQVEAKREHDARVLRRRARKLKGEAVDLPDVYLRATYPDPNAPKGYTAPGGTINTTTTTMKALTGSYEAEDALDPKRVVKDHFQALQLHRIDLQNRHLAEEAHRQEAAEKQRQSVAKQLKERRVDEDEFLAAWMEDRPRISRSREAQRHDEVAAEKRTAAHLNHVQRAEARELYARCAMADSAEMTAHQQELRRRVLTRPTSRRGRKTGRVQDREGEGVPTSGRQGSKASSRAASPANATTTTNSCTGSKAAEGTAERENNTNIDVRPVTPSQLGGPTSTNFFNELKLWTQEFPSPNTIPANAAEAEHRRAWKAELDEAQLAFNRASTQRQRADYPHRILAAREKTHEANWTHAEGERQEKKTFAAKRAGHVQAGLLAATAMRVGVQDEAQRAQGQRQALAAKKHDEVQFQRLQLKQREEVLRSLEAEELQQLRLIVSANGRRA